MLRVVDPSFKTKTLEDYGLAYVFISFFEIAIVTITPSLVANGIIWLPAIVLTAAAIGCFVLAALTCGYYAKVPKNALREGEIEIMKEFQEMTGERLV